MIFKPPLLWILKQIGKSVPFEKLLRHSGSQLFLPFYHTVSDQYLPHIQPISTVRNVKEFEKELDFLLMHFQPVELSDVLMAVENHRSFSRPVFHLSFDDGLKECYETIVPLLKKKGIPATFFLNSSFLDNKALFFRYKAALLIDRLPVLTTAAKRQLADLINVRKANEQKINAGLMKISFPQRHMLDEAAKIVGLDFNKFLEKERPYLSVGQIKKMQHDGFTVGSHSADHPHFAGLSPDRQAGQVLSDLEFLKKKFNPGNFVFAFPFSDDGVENAFFLMLRNEIKIDLSFGTSGLKKDAYPWHLQRFPMEHFEARPEQVIPQAYLYYALKKLLNVHKKHH